MIIEKKPTTNIELRVTTNYKYLGTNISENGKCIKEVKIHIALAKTAFWKYKELFSKMSLSVKRRSHVVISGQC